MSMDLQWLLNPIEKQVFFDVYLEQKPLIIRRNQPDYFKSLLSISDLDDLMFKVANPGRLDVAVVNASKKYQLTEYADVNIIGNVQVKSSINLPKLLKLFSEDKATIIINQAVNEWEPLRTLAENYAAEVNFMPGGNIFIAPANAECFGAHFDEHDLFILQVHGSKHWKIYENATFLPSEPQRGRHFDFSALKLLYEIDLQQGDTLYLPRGFVHDVTTTATTSVHISFGGLHLTWSRMIRNFVTTVAKNKRLLRQRARVTEDGSVEQEVIDLLKMELSQLNNEKLKNVAPKFRFPERSTIFE
jgi:ribosomal protein L16 Arg81 hydroxylase